MLLLSAEFNLNEIHALECLLEAHTEVAHFSALASTQGPALPYYNLRTLTALLRLQRGDVSAEAGAGVYFEERRAMLMTLHRLLQVRVLPDHLF